jgi:hypothetical protein
MRQHHAVRNSSNRRPVTEPLWYGPGIPSCHARAEGNDNPKPTATAQPAPKSNESPPERPQLSGRNVGFRGRRADTTAAQTTADSCRRGCFSRFRPYDFAINPEFVIPDIARKLVKAIRPYFVPVTCWRTH